MFITGDTTIAKIEPVEIDEVDVKIDMKIDLEKDSPDLNIIDKGKLHLNEVEYLIPLHLCIVGKFLEVISLL